MIVPVVVAYHVPLCVDLYVDGRDPALDHARDEQPCAPGADRVERVADHIDGHTEVDQRAEHHVAGGAARAVDVQVHAFHATSLAIFTAATAAPTPLSMLTTVTPGAQPASSAPSATSPSTETP